MVRLIGFSQNLNILTSGVSIPEMVRLIVNVCLPFHTDISVSIPEMVRLIVGVCIKNPGRNVSFNSKDGAIDSQPAGLFLSFCHVSIPKMVRLIVKMQ